MKNDSAGLTIRDTIIQLLIDKHIVYELTSHRPVYTMEQAAQVCGHKPEAGVKVLMVRTYLSKTHYNFALVVWRGDRKVDWNEVAKKLSVKKVSMANDDEVRQTLGIEIGALTPLGYEKKLPVLFDNALLENENVYINPGKHDETMKIGANDLLELIKVWAGSTVAIVEISSHSN